LDAEPNWVGLAETVIVGLAIWWVWVYTTWATNWLDPETRPVLWLLLVLMLLGLILSQSIPEAFGDRGVLFVAAYIAYFVVRTLFLIAASAKHRPQIAAGQRRILVWCAASAPFWIVGALLPLDVRLVLWGVAILIDYVGPATLFWLPGRGRSSWESWQIRGAHFAERSALFIIIVLGESILVTGEALSGNRLTVLSVSSFGAAFIDSVLLWLLYFSRGERGGTRYITSLAANGPVARISYTYLHVVLVLGIVLTTHADAVALHHPEDTATLTTVALATLGPALYLAGNLAFKRSVGLAWSASHVGGIVIYAVILLLAVGRVLDVDSLTLAWLSTAVLAAVTIFENGVKRMSGRATHKEGVTANG
jgi:low temperature requirement protein LtrA